MTSNYCILPYKQVFIGISVSTYIGKRQNRHRMGFIDFRKKLVPKHCGFHDEKPTSGLEFPTGSGQVPHAIARIKLYMLPKFHPNRSTRIWGDNIFNVWFLISCLTSWSWGSVKNCVPSYQAHQTAGVCEISGKNMNRKSDFHLGSKSFGIPAYTLHTSWATCSS